MKPDQTVCFCYQVSLRKIVNYIRRERPPVASLISQCLSAGTGCGWCVPFLRKLHRDVLAGKLDGMDPLGFEDYERMRSGWLDESRPDRDLETFAEQTATTPQSDDDGENPKDSP